MFHSEPVTRNVVKKMMAFHTRKYEYESEQDRIKGEKEINAILESSATAEQRKFYFNFAKQSFITFTFLGLFLAVGINILSIAILEFSPYVSYFAFLLFCLPVGIIVTLHFKAKNVTSSSSYSTFNLLTGVFLGFLIAGIVNYFWQNII